MKKVVRHWQLLFSALIAILSGAMAAKKGMSLINVLPQGIATIRFLLPRKMLK